jgi:hypothetical protein
VKEKPAIMAPASGPTIADEEAVARDATERAHDPATGRFIRAGSPGPRIAARRAQVASLYPEKTCAEIGAELGWAAPTILQDVRALGLERRRPGPRRKHPELNERECANPDCDERFTPASWEPDRRYHDHPCAMRATRTELVRETARSLMLERRPRVDAEIARLNADGFLTSRQLAAERKVTESAVSQWIRWDLLCAERRLIEGEPHRIIRQEEFERFNAEEWPRICERMGPNFPGNWGGDRRRLWSRRLRAPEVGLLGGAPRTELPPAVVAEVHRLTDLRYGRDYIAARLGISPRQVRNARKLAGTEP